MGLFKIGISLKGIVFFNSVLCQQLLVLYYRYQWLSWCARWCFDFQIIAADSVWALPVPIQFALVCWRTTNQIDLLYQVFIIRVFPFNYSYVVQAFHQEGLSFQDLTSTNEPIMKIFHHAQVSSSKLCLLLDFLFEYKHPESHLHWTAILW